MVKPSGAGMVNPSLHPLHMLILKWFGYHQRDIISDNFGVVIFMAEDSWCIAAMPSDIAQIVLISGHSQ